MSVPTTEFLTLWLVFLTDCGPGKSELLLVPMHKLEHKSVKDGLKLFFSSAFFLWWI